MEAVVEPVEVGGVDGPAVAHPGPAHPRTGRRGSTTPRRVPRRRDSIPRPAGGRPGRGCSSPRSRRWRWWRPWDGCLSRHRRSHSGILVVNAQSTWKCTGPRRLFLVDIQHFPAISSGVGEVFPRRPGGERKPVREGVQGTPWQGKAERYGYRFRSLGGMETKAGDTAEGRAAGSACDDRRSESVAPAGRGVRAGQADEWRRSTADERTRGRGAGAVERRNSGSGPAVRGYSDPSHDKGRSPAMPGKHPDEERGASAEVPVGCDPAVDLRTEHAAVGDFLPAAVVFDTARSNRNSGRCRGRPRGDRCVR